MEIRRKKKLLKGLKGIYIILIIPGLLVIALIIGHLTNGAEGKNAIQTEEKEEAEKDEAEKDEMEKDNVLQILRLENLIWPIEQEEEALPYKIKLYSKSEEAVDNAVPLNEVVRSEVNIGKAEYRRINCSFISESDTIIELTRGLILEKNMWGSYEDINSDLRTTGNITTFQLNISPQYEPVTVLYELEFLKKDNDSYTRFIAFRLEPQSTEE